MNPLLTTGLDAHRGMTALSVNLNKVAQLHGVDVLNINEKVVDEIQELVFQAQDHRCGSGTDRLLWFSSGDLQSNGPVYYRQPLCQ